MNEYSENLILRTMHENALSYLEAIKKLDEEAAEHISEEIEADEGLWYGYEPFYGGDDSYDYEYGWY